MAPALRSASTASTGVSAALRVIGLVIGGFLLGAGLVAVAARFGDHAPAIVIAIPIVPLVVASILLRPLFAAPVVFASIAFGLVSIPVGPLNVQAQEAAVLIVAALVALRRVSEGDPPLSWSPHLAWAGALTLWAVIALPSAADQEMAIKTVGSFAYAITFSCVVLATCDTLEDLRWIFGVLVLVASVITLPALQNADDLRAAQSSGIIVGRAQGFFPSPNGLGGFSALAALVGIGLTFAARTVRGRVGALLATTVLLAGLILSLSRGAWLGMSAGLILLVLALGRVRRTLIVWAIPVLVIGLFAGAFAPSRPELQVIGQRVADLGAVQSYDDRPELWAEALRQIREDPWTGQGPGNFERASRRQVSGTLSVSASHAHNQVLNTAAEMGVPGGLLLLGFALALGVAARHTLRRLPESGHHRDRALVAGMAAALLARFTQGLVDEALGNPLTDSVIWGLVGGLLVAWRMTRERRDSQFTLTPGRRTPPGGGTPRSEARTS
jgi:putative inorganic carbon (hco3(-)) transporter